MKKITKLTNGREIMVLDLLQAEIIDSASKVKLFKPLLLSSSELNGYPMIRRKEVELSEKIFQQKESKIIRNLEYDWNLTDKYISGKLPTDISVKRLLAAKYIGTHEPVFLISFGTDNMLRLGLSNLDAYVEI